MYLNFGSFFGPPLVQNLAGTGSWTGSPRLLIDSLSTTTMLNDLTYDGGNLFVEGRLNTGAFTLSLILFWLGLVNAAALRDVGRQHAMVCAFITAAEYQQRFSFVVTHSNAECPQ